MVVAKHYLCKELKCQTSPRVIERNSWVQGPLCKKEALPGCSLKCWRQLKIMIHENQSLEKKMCFKHNTSGFCILHQKVRLGVKGLKHVSLSPLSLIGKHQATLLSWELRASAHKQNKRAIFFCIYIVLYIDSSPLWISCYVTKLCNGESWGSQIWLLCLKTRKLAR